MSRSIYVATSESKAADATGNDVPKTPKPDDPADLVDRLLKAAGPAKAVELMTQAIGSKAEAHRLVDAANFRGRSSGRPTEYFTTDAYVQFTEQMLERAYRRNGEKVPNRQVLIEAALRLQELADGRQFGETRQAAISRIRRRPRGMMFYTTDVPEQDRVSFDKLHEFWASVLEPDYLAKVLKRDPDLYYFTAGFIMFTLEKIFERIRVVAEEKL
jgi:hypothetical protein